MIPEGDLASIRRLPVDEIKIDRSFVMNMASVESDAVIVRSTIDLGHNLGLRVVAEGVETRAIWDLLSELECDVAQGYFLSRPLPPADVARWIRDWGTGRDGGDHTSGPASGERVDTEGATAIPSLVPQIEK